MKDNQYWLRLIALGIALEIIAGAGVAFFRGSDDTHGPGRIVIVALGLMIFIVTISLIVLLVIYLFVNLFKPAQTTSPVTDRSAMQPGPPGFPVVALDSEAHNQGNRHYPGVTVIPEYSPPTDGPGVYRIQGVSRDTKTDVTKEIEADSTANAKVKAELDGIVVTSVAKTTDIAPSVTFEDVDSTPPVS